MKFVSITLLLGCVVGMAAAEGLTGVVSGQPWTMVSAHESPFGSDDPGMLELNLYAEAVDPGFPRSEKPSVMLTLPKAPGTYALDSRSTVTFYLPPETNLLATEGTVVIESGEDEGELVFSLDVRYDDSNRVAGSFSFIPK